MTTEINKEKVPWILILPFVMVLMVLGTIWICILPSNMTLFYNPGDVNCSMEFTAMPYLTMLIGVGFYLLSKRKVNVTTLAYIYAATIICTYYLGYGAYDMPAGIPAGRWTNPTESGAWLKWFMAPPSDVAPQILAGGVPVQWGAWLPTIIYWWALFSMFGVFMLSVSTFWRHQWMEVEKVPFPTTMAVHQIMEHATGQKKSKRPYLIGIILGLCFQLPIYLATVFPWFPDIFGWRTNTACYGAGWVTSDSGLYSIAGLGYFSKNPALGALFYMAPLSTLLSGSIFTLAFFVLTQAAYMMGYYTDVMNLPGCGRAECGTSSYVWGAPFKWSIITNMGGGLGLVSSYFFLNRRYLMDTFKDAFGGVKLEGRSDEVPYRRVYLLLAGSFILIVALLMMIGLSAINAILAPIMTFVFYFATMFIFSRVGYNAIGLGAYGLYYLRAVWPELPTDRTPDYVLTITLMRQAGSDGFSKGWGGGLASSFQGYRMASITNTSSRNVFQIMLATALLAPLVWWITFLSLSYSIGLTRLGVYQANTGVARDIFRYADPSNTWSGIDPQGMSGGPWLPNLVAGIVIVWLLSFMHARFVWWPLDQYGFILAFCSRGFSEGIWTMIIAAWVLKAITLRMGGSKLYEDVGVPVATGFLLGYALSILAGGFISSIRFFVPF